MRAAPRLGRDAPRTPPAPWASSCPSCAEVPRSGASQVRSWVGIAAASYFVVRAAGPGGRAVPVRSLSARWPPGRGRRAPRGRGGRKGVASGLGAAGAAEPAGLCAGSPGAAEPGSASLDHPVRRRQLTGRGQARWGLRPSTVRAEAALPGRPEGPLQPP